MSRILSPTDANLHLAAQAIGEGLLVGIPTETVYGIAADAFNETAVRATFEAKGRPAENPLIVHIGELRQLDRIGRDLSVAALHLSRRFWPGPLTLVVPKQKDLPKVTTGGLDTVAVRMPKHPIPRRLSQLSRTALSAPSANSFTGLSPTRADHISSLLGAKMELILDGGQCKVGVESTVVDTTGDVIRILRPGAVSETMLKHFLNPLGFDVTVNSPTAEALADEHRSPGMYAKHYAPKTPLRIVEKLGPLDAGIVFDPPLNSDQLRLPKRAAAYRAALYASLHELDSRALPELLIQSPPQTPAWAAVWDRLRRAASE